MLWWIGSYSIMHINTMSWWNVWIEAWSWRVYMCSYERIAHVYTLIHLCMNNVKFECVFPTSYYVKGFLTYMYRHRAMKCMNKAMSLYSSKIGSFERFVQWYSKLVYISCMVCPCERFFTCVRLMKGHSYL